VLLYCLVDVDSEKEGGGTDSGISSIREAVIEFQEYKAIDSYEAQGDGQVSFEEGDIIQVLDKIEDGRSHTHTQTPEETEFCALSGSLLYSLISYAPPQYCSIISFIPFIPHHFLCSA
jgi:hypothetical protein